MLLSVVEFPLITMLIRTIDLLMETNMVPENCVINFMHVSKNLPNHTENVCISNNLFGCNIFSFVG